MKSLACVFCVAAAAWGAEPALQTKALAEGRHLIAVSGMLCHLCEKAIALELGRLPEVESVEADFDRGEVRLSVRKGRKLEAAALRKGLRRAAKRANLGNEFELEGASPAP